MPDTAPDTSTTAPAPERDERLLPVEDKPLSKLPITAIVALAFVVGLALVGLVTSTAAPDVDPSKLEAAPLPVSVIEARLESTYTVGRQFVGRIEARRESRVGFELDGRIERMGVEEGDGVSRGQVLAELDTDRLEARRLGLLARVDRAEAEAALARTTLERVREAQDLDAVSTQALDEAELGSRAREAVLAEAQAALEQIDVELEKSRLEAPYDAIVAGRSADEGQVVAAGTPVLHLLESRRPEARIGVAGPAIDALAIGNAVEVAIGRQSISAVVRAILPLRGRSTRAVDVILELEADLEGTDGNPDRPRVRSGDLARIAVEQTIDSPGFWLPISALTESSRGLWAVYVVNTENQVERRELELLHEEAERVYVHGTLADGEKVVVTGLHRLVPDQRVRIETSGSGPRSGAGETDPPTGGAQR